MTCVKHLVKVGIPNFVSGPREYIMEGEYVILAMCFMVPYWVDRKHGVFYVVKTIRLGCYAMGLPMSDSVRNCGRSRVL